MPNVFTLALFQCGQWNVNNLNNKSVGPDKICNVQKMCKWNQSVLWKFQILAKYRMWFKLEVQIKSNKLLCEVQKSKIQNN